MQVPDAARAEFWPVPLASANGRRRGPGLLFLDYGASLTNPTDQDRRPRLLRFAADGESNAYSPNEYPNSLVNRYADTETADTTGEQRGHP
jgi:hypothetical protein